jgi:hypothetical protein
MSIELVKAIVSRAAVYVPFDSEGIRIEYWDDDEEIASIAETEDYTGRFFGTGEETGDSYSIDYASVNLEEDSFYELKLIEVDKR